jgi:phage-related holin
MINFVVKVVTNHRILMYPLLLSFYIIYELTDITRNCLRAGIT